MDRKYIHERRIRVTDKESSVQLPDEWVKSIPGEKKSVFIYIVNNDLILSPSTIPNPKKRRGEMKYNDETKKNLESLIISAYISNYDEIILNSDKNISSYNGLVGILNLFYNASINPPESPTKIVISFRDESNKTYNEIIQTAHNYILELHEKNNEIFKEMEINTSELEQKKQDVLGFEYEIDKLSFYSKRMLNKAIFDANTLEYLGIKDLQNILEANSIMTNYEHLGNIQRDIFQCLCCIHRENGFQNSEIFSNYYQKAFEYYCSIQNKILNTENFIPEYKLKRNEEFGFHYLDDFIGEKSRWGFLKQIKNLEKSNRLYAILEDKIWSIVELTNKIEKANLNIMFKNVLTTPEL